METRATIWVHRGDEEIELTIVGEVVPYTPGRYSGPPEDCYEADGGWAEIEAVLCAGQPWSGTLTAEERGWAEAALQHADSERESMRASERERMRYPF